MSGVVILCFLGPYHPHILWIMISRAMSDFTMKNGVGKFLNNGTMLMMSKRDFEISKKPYSSMETSYFQRLHKVVPHRGDTEHIIT